MWIGRNLVSRGAAAVGLLVLLLVLLVLQTDFLQQITRPREARIAQVSDETVHKFWSSDDVAAAAARGSKLSCDLSSYRMDICAMEGDVRMHGKSATVYVVAASGDSYRPENATVRTHPYPRKWEEGTMQTVREVTLRWISSTDVDAPPPRCTVTSAVPAVVFSTTGDHGKNNYHVMTDILIPLYNKARAYDGHVQLVATDYSRELVSKYRHILGALSVYPVLDFDADEAVRCFPSVHVGIEGTDAGLSINPVPSGKGYTMVDFRDFLRSAYSLKQQPARRQRPRLLVISRRRSRVITNEAEAIAAAAEVGFEVVSAGPEMVRDMAKIGELVSSCDVMVGVHGAGLTNMVFLPHNATVLQIIPWGNMRELSLAEYGRPLPDMGLRHAEYEVGAEETTLKEVYPKDHPVFADPTSVHEQGWGKVWEIFLNGQNITLDIDRFRGAMKQIYQSITVT